MELYVTDKTGIQKLVEFAVAQTVTLADHSVRISGDVLSGEERKGLVPDKIRVSTPAEPTEPATVRMTTDSDEGL